MTFWVASVLAQGFIDSLKIVDYHVHVFSEELLNNVFAQGYRFEQGDFQNIHADLKKYADVDVLLSRNLNAKMILISTGYAYRSVDSTRAFPGEELLRKENTMLSDLVRINPEKFIGFCGIGPLTPYALDEIERCHRDLGLTGIKLHLQGCHVDIFDSTHLEAVRKVFELAARLKMPLLVHNNGWKMDSGAEYVEAFTRNILAKVDSTTIIFAHAGGPGGYNDFTRQFILGMDDYLKNGETAARHNIYFELSGVILRKPDPGKRPPEELLALINEVGEEHFLFGSDYPFRNSEQYLAEILSEVKFDPEQLKRIVERDIFD